MSGKNKILFVCMGNICRSPAAEGVFSKFVEDAGLADQFHIDSAGTIGYHAGNPADSRMRAAASARGYSLESRARRIAPADLRDFDWIVAMDDDNYRDIRSMGSDAQSRQGARVVRMCDYCTRHDADEVPDPYYGGAAGFEHVLDILEDACQNFLEKLKTQA